MSRLTGWLYSLRALLRRDAADRDMAEEIAFHVDRQTRKHESRGASSDDAHRRALQEFGGTTRWREETRDARAGAAIDVIQQDLRYAARGLMRRPGFTAVAVLTLAIGIGGTTAIFSAVNTLLLRRLPYAAPEQLMTVSLTSPAVGGLRARDDSPWSYPKYVVFRDAQSVFTDMSLYSSPQRLTATSGAVELLQGELVGARYLRTLGLAPVQGRDFDPGIDAHAGAERQAIISHSLWQRRYNADPSVVGKTLNLDGTPYTVIGVAPIGFRGLSGQGEVFIPITTRAARDLDEDQYHEFFLVARRRPGIGAAGATTAVNLLGPRVRDAFPGPEMGGGQWGATARPLGDSRVSPLVRRSLLVAFGAVVFVLLIACVNVANLLLGRASTRRREMAVRLALGASRLRLVRLLFTEHLLLAAFGGLAGVAVAWLGTRALSTIDSAAMVPKGNDSLSALGAMSFSEIHLDWEALAFGASITLLVGLAFGLVPALRATGRALADATKLTAGDNDARPRGIGGRRALVVAEVALAMILLVGSGLLMRSFSKLTAIDPGFDAQHVLTLRLTIPPNVPEESMPAFYTELLDRLRALPGVVEASLNSCPPLGGGCYRTPFEFPDRPKVGAAARADIRVNWVTPTWFSTLHVPLERGRLFVAADRAGAPSVALINEAAARTFWAGENPIGKRVSIGGDDATVVGIVGDVRQFVDSLPKPDVYLPFAQAPSSQVVMFVRAAGEPVALAADIRRAIRELAPHFPVYDIQTMTARAAGATAQSRLSTTLVSLFAATALALTVVGIYGVMGLAVTSRTREIGIRIALGADQNRLQRGVVGEGMMLASIGAVIGLAGALAATRVLQTLLFDLSPTDPITYGAMLVLVGIATVAASWIPARRAARVDPVVALRAD